ncbi:MAG: TonB-dependent receptor [Chitinophagales bacterium]|nr:TonB-dependent receptor [Chitinophagales bacterium]
MKRLSILLFLFLICFSVFAQKGFIKGQVTDTKSKEALFGVSVSSAVGTGTTTDFDGKFSLEVEPGRYEVTFSFVGYSELVKDVKVNAGETIELNVSMFEKLEELNIVVVTGSKFEKNVSEEVNSIDVLKPDMIKNSNNVTLAESINKISGVTIVDNSIGIRGGSTYSYGVGSRVLLLVDGLPINTVDRGDIRWNNVPMEITDQVEVIKGASSALYGASALNGVINVITTYPKSEEAETEATLFYQGYATPRREELKWWGPPKEGNIAAADDPDLPPPQRYGGSFSFKKRVDERYDFVVGANFMKERGIIRLNDQQFVRIVAKFRHRPVKIDRLSYGLNVNMQDSKESDFFFWKNGGNGAYVPYDSDNYNDDGSATTYRKQIVTLDPWTIYHDKNENKHLLRFRYQYQATQFGSNYPLFHSVMAEYQIQREFRRKLRLTGGLMAQYFTVTDETMIQGTFHDGSLMALYGQVDKSFGRFNVVFGARWEIYKIDNEYGYLSPVLISGEDNEDVNNVPLPVVNIGLNYKAGRRTYLRMNSGMGFRIPSFTERYVSANAGPINAFSNPDLLPEFGISGEIAAKQGIQISKWLAYIDLAFFWQEYWELVEYKFGVYPPDPLPPGTNSFDFLGFKPSNTSRARVAGLEFSFTGEGKIGKIPMRLLGGYTFTYPVELSEAGDTTKTLNKFGTYMKYFFKSMGGMDDELYAGLLGYRYRHQLKANIEVDVNKFTFGMEFQYYSFMEKVEYVFTLFIPDVNEFRDVQQARRVQGDIFLNLRAAYDFSTNDKNLGKISLIVGNVLNRESAVRIAKMDPPLNFTVQYRINI